MKLSESKFKAIKEGLPLPTDTEADEAMLVCTSFADNADIARSICYSYEIDLEANYHLILSILEGPSL